VSVVVQIPGALRSLTGGQSRVTLDPSPPTVADALRVLCALHPGLSDRVLDDQGRVRPHVNVFVGMESIRDLGGLGARVPEGAEIAIIPAVSGG
jgi:molybdopterin converting factor small subunit